MQPRALFVLLLVGIFLVPMGTLAADTGAPDFGPNVLIFDPSTPGIQQKIDGVFQQQERSEFGTHRWAYLFKPGKYNLDVQTGFYMQVAGLGQSPDDVSITGPVRSMAGWAHGNATVNFWRAAENLSVTPTGRTHTDVWAVSQGTALRRVHVHGNMNLWDGGWSSGGFLADSKVDGQVVSGSQQQWLSRNADWSRWDGGVWNMVFVGVPAAPAGEWPDRPFTVVDQTPIVAEKPYLRIDAAGHYLVSVPPVQASGSHGISWATGAGAGAEIPIEQFYLAHPDRDTAASINAALASGQNLLLTPGVYSLESAIHVTRADTVVLGLGYPTLVPKGAEPAMIVSDVDGVKVGGMILDAGTTQTPALLQVGDAGSSASHAANPICLYDLFARAGGATAGTTETFVTINSNNVIGDNLWLWRADHGRGARWNENKVRNGLVVNGNDVTMYGLFVEHCQEYQTLWNGNGGRVYFYQSEMPYDPPSQQAWSHNGVRGWASYKVADSVTSHQAWGLGIYCVFNAAPVMADNAIETPTAPGVKMHDMAIVRLGGKAGSGIAHVYNGRGDGENEVKPVKLSQ